MSVRAGETHNGELYAVDAATGRRARQHRPSATSFPQGLSRNARTVVAAIGCGGLASPYGAIQTIPFAGGHPRVIVRAPCRANSNF